jgi:SAM-dependent methyltransferase
MSTGDSEVARQRYLLDNQQAEAGQRFDALSALFNPSTFRHMEGIGLSVGWRVWEVGAGGPSVPTWIVEQTNGHVLASDIDTSWLTTEHVAFEIRRHDIGTEPAPDGLFDLVHARLVLVHVPERTNALSTMISALKPGGWLLVEEADPGLQPLACPDEWGAEQQLANKLKAAFRSLMAERGVDLSFGRQLPRLLRSAGLVDVQSDAYFPIGGPACNELERATVEQIRDRLISSGLATEDEIEQHRSNVATGQLDVATSPMVSAWGRKPHR